MCQIDWGKCHPLLLAGLIGSGRLGRRKIPEDLSLEELKLLGAELGSPSRIGILFGQLGDAQLAFLLLVLQQQVSRERGKWLRDSEAYRIE